MEFQENQQSQNTDQQQQQQQQNDEGVISQETHMANLPQKYNKSNYQRNFKIILKNFSHLFDKHELWIFYEFAQFETDLVFYMIENYNHQFMRKLKREYMSNQKNAYKILHEIISKYCYSKGIKDWDEHLIEKEQEYEKELLKEEQKNNLNDINKGNEQQEENKEEQEIGMIMEFSDGIIVKIMEYLDPLTLGKIQICNKRFQKLAQGQFLWKKICLSLIKPGLPQLPQVTPFQLYQMVIINRPIDFKPEFYQAVCQDVRKAIWYEPDSLFKTSAAYFKQFKNWYSMYISAPRVNYGGVYQLKEIIMRIGQIEYGHHFAPIIKEKYYRYIRFFPDGKLRVKVSPRKLSKEKIIEYMLDTDYDTEFTRSNEIKVGEFKQCKDQLIIKYTLGSSIFESTLKIQHQENLPNYVLQVEKQVQFIRDNLQGNQESLIYKIAKHVSPKFYKYIPIKQIRDDLTDNNIATLTL